ncbi:MAG: thiol reductant ABC exporter subunit CydC [Bacillota bacterium]
MKYLLFLLEIIVPSWPWVLLAVFLGFFAAGSTVGLMATAALLISGAALHPPVAGLIIPIVGVRFFGLSRAVFRYLERYVAHDAVFRVLREIRVRLYTALEPLAPARLTDHHSGDLLSRLVTDIETLQNFSLRVVAPPLVALLVLAGTAFFLVWFEPVLVLALLGFFIAGGVAVPLLARSLGRGVGRRMIEVRGILNAHLVDTVQGMSEIIAFGQDGRQQERIGALSRELLRLQGRAAGVSALSNAATGLAMNLALWSVLLLTVPLVSREELDGVYLAMLALGAQSSFEVLPPLPMVFHYLEESLAAGKRVLALFGAEAAVQVPPGFSPVPAGCSTGCDLRVEGLRFRYGPDEPYVLDGVDFVLPAGGRLAVVGPNGAGKSTLVNLLSRFWDYQEGAIYLGGHELKAYNPEDVRGLISVVTQRTYLFNTTVRENLLLARPRATREELIRAAREAQIHDFIESLPRGYDTYIGEGGGKLSGGQRQRLAIARAFLKNAPFLILDEATADLDPITERELLQAIYRLMQGRTTLVITHRLVGLEAMDEILVLEGGRVVERGRHATLLQRGGFYRRMWELQQEMLLSAIPDGNSMDRRFQALSPLA